MESNLQRNGIRFIIVLLDKARRERQRGVDASAKIVEKLRPSPVASAPRGASLADFGRDPLGDGFKRWCSSPSTRSSDWPNSRRPPASPTWLLRGARRATKWKRRPPSTYGRRIWATTAIGGSSHDRLGDPRPGQSAGGIDAHGDPSRWHRHVPGPDPLRLARRAGSWRTLPGSNLNIAGTAGANSRSPSSGPISMCRPGAACLKGSHHAPQSDIYACRRGTRPSRARSGEGRSVGVLDARVAARVAPTSTPLAKKCRSGRFARLQAWPFRPEVRAGMIMPCSSPRHARSDAHAEASAPRVESSWWHGWRPVVGRFACAPSSSIPSTSIPHNTGSPRARLNTLTNTSSTIIINNTASTTSTIGIYAR